MSGTNQRIDAKRLWDSLMAMAEFGATPKGGVKRLTLSDVDKRGRDAFSGWALAGGALPRVTEYNKNGSEFNRPGTKS